MRMYESGSRYLSHREHNPAALGTHSENVTGAAQCQIWVSSAEDMWQMTKFSAGHVLEGHAQQVQTDVVHWKDLQEG